MQKKYDTEWDKPLWGLKVQAPVARSGSGQGPVRRFPVFPKVDTPLRARGLIAPPGLWPWAPRVLPVIG